MLRLKLLLKEVLPARKNNKKRIKNIGTLSVQELFFQLIGLLGVRLGVSPVGMVELFVYGASLTT